MANFKPKSGAVRPMPLSKWIGQRRQQLSARLFVLHERSRKVTQKLQLEGLDEGESTLAGTPDLLKRLLSAEKHMRQMLVDHPSAVFVVSPDGQVQMSNRAARDLLGTLGRSIDVDANDVQIDDLLPDAMIRDQLEFPLGKSQGGGLIALVVKRMPVMWGNANSTLLLLYDVTPQAQARLELERAVEQLEAVNRLKSEFITMASHEFRTPLTSVLSSLELMSEYVRRADDELNGEFVKRMTRHLTRSREAVNHLDEMVAEMLVLEKTNAGQFQCQPVMTDLAPAIRDVMASVSPTCEQAKVHMELTCDDTVPAYVDERLVRHVLSNLLTNAIRFTPADGTVKVTFESTDTGLKLEVEDTGIGIPDADQAQICETFYRGQNGQHASGSGLGLAIVKRFVDLHEGTIELKSNVGQGTCFEVFFPAPTG